MFITLSVHLCLQYIYWSAAVQRCALTEYLPVRLQLTFNCSSKLQLHKTQS